MYRIRLVLVNPAGVPLGTLPFFEVDTPWWPEVGSVTTVARDRFGVELVVLRMLDVEAAGVVPYETVTYSAEAIDDPPSLELMPVPEGLPYGDEPQRAVWARPGGIASITSWADAALTDLGMARIGPVQQVKTWNLSSILRLPIEDGAVWCKSVPAFFAHEADVIRLVASERASLVPRVLASRQAPATTLLADLGNDEQSDAPEGRLLEMVRSLVALQAAWAGRTDALLSAGVPDRRDAPLVRDLQAMIARPDIRSTVNPGERADLDRLAAEIPERMAALAACGIPETIVHGDFWPGNWMEHDGHLVLFDWGDSSVGHPMFDTAPLLGSPEHASVRSTLQATWADAWRSAAPGSDPERAMAVIPPLAALRQALVYRMFLDRIEPSEHRCHAQDVPDWLRMALRLANGDSGW